MQQIITFFLEPILSLCLNQYTLFSFYPCKVCIYCRSDFCPALMIYFFPLNHYDASAFRNNYSM